MVSRWVRSITSGFWFIPAGCTVLAVLGALLLVEFDKRYTGKASPLLFPGGPDGARAVLSAITSSMISFTALVFSITVVVLQLTSSQFSPRILRTFLRDRVSQIALGVFAATFIYAMTVLRSVRGESTAEEFVPRVATTVSFLLVVVSIGVFIWYIQHISNAIRAASILDAVAVETRGLLEKRYPADARYPEAPSSSLLGTIRAWRPGIVAAVDVSRLVEVARRHDCLLELVPFVGGFVPEGADLFRVNQGPGGQVGDLPDEGAVRTGIVFAVERTMEQDVAYGFRQLTDVAERVLSPSVNDHTTAIQAVDQHHDLLRRMVTRPMPERVHADSDGTVRLVVHEIGLSEYLDVAIGQVAQWGSGSPRVMARLREVLDDLTTVARPEHLSAIREHARLIERSDIKPQ